MRWLPWILAGVVLAGIGVTWWVLSRRGVRAPVGRRETVVLTELATGTQRETTMATGSSGRFVQFGPDGLPVGS